MKLCLQLVIKLAPESLPALEWWRTLFFFPHLNPGVPWSLKTAALLGLSTSHLPSMQNAPLLSIKKKGESIPSQSEPLAWPARRENPSSVFFNLCSWEPGRCWIHFPLLLTHILAVPLVKWTILDKASHDCGIETAYCLWCAQSSTCFPTLMLKPEGLLETIHHFSISYVF